MFEISPYRIFEAIIFTIPVVDYIYHEIKIHRYKKVKAEIVDYHNDNDAIRCGYSKMQKIIVYRYYCNGTEHTGCESVIVSKRKLAKTKTCIIYIDPDDCEKFITSFRISLWRKIFFSILIGVIIICLVYNLTSKNPNVLSEMNTIRRHGKQ